MNEEQIAALARVAREEGQRAAAQGTVNSVNNPYTVVERAWEAGNRAGVVHLHGGRDSQGHNATAPHLCAANPLKVCTCCQSCAADCVPLVRLVRKAVRRLRARFLP